MWVVVVLGVRVMGWGMYLVEAGLKLGYDVCHVGFLSPFLCSKL